MSEAVTWPDWISKHAAIFGMSQEGQLLTLKEWARLFDRQGYTPREMIEASEWVAMNSEVRFREELLPKLRNRARDARLIASRPRLADPPPEDFNVPRCPGCKGEGLVKVPHYEKMMHHLYAGRYWYDQDVACTCSLGQWYRKSRAGTIFHLMSIDEYESRYPSWREDAEQHRQEEEAFQLAMHLARNDDSSFGALVQRLVAKAQQRKAVQK